MNKKDVIKDVMVGVKMTTAFKDRLQKLKATYEAKESVELSMSQFVMKILNDYDKNSQN